MSKFSILFLLASLGSAPSYAAENGNEPSNVFQLGKIRGPQGSAVVKILSGLEKVYAEVSSTGVPPFVKAYAIRHVGEISNVDEWVERYGHFFAIGIKPARLLGVEVDLQRVHELAASEAGVAEEDISGHEHPRPDSYPDRYKAAFETLRALYQRAGFKDIPSYARQFGLSLVDASDSVAGIHTKVYAYKLAFEFSRASLDDEGLGLDVEDSHAHAVEIYDRRLVDVGAELEIAARKDVFRKLSAPVEDKGFGMEPNAARAEAARLVALDFIPNARQLVDRLEIRRVLARFMATPIREKGLGFTPEEIESQLEEWVGRFSKDFGANAAIERYINNYGSALAAYLTKTVKAGVYDEVAAREWSIAFLEDKDLYVVRRHLAEVGFEQVDFDRMPPIPVPKPPGLVRRVKNCMLLFLLGK